MRHILVHMRTPHISPHSWTVRFLCVCVCTGYKFLFSPSYQKGGKSSLFLFFFFFFLIFPLFTSTFLNGIFVSIILKTAWHIHLQRAGSVLVDQTQVFRIAGGFFTSWATGRLKNTGLGSLSLFQRVFLTQESNQGLLHCRQILYQLSYQESPTVQQSPLSLPSVSLIMG